MKLLCTLRSPYARKARIIALEKGIELEIVEEDLTHKSDNLLKLNPIGKVPTLVLDDNTALCDSVLICEYLESQVEDPVLIPVGPDQRFKVKNIAAIADGLADVAVSIFFQKLLYKEEAHSKFIQRQEETIVRTLKYFQLNIKDLQEFNLAAIAVICAVDYVIFRNEHLSPKHHAPELYQWLQSMHQRESVRQTVPKE